MDRSKLPNAVRDALDLIEQYGSIDGGHHKQWLLDQVVRALLGPDYDDWLAEMNADPDYDPWDHGIPP